MKVVTNDGIHQFLAFKWFSTLKIVQKGQKMEKMAKNGPIRSI